MPWVKDTQSIKPRILYIAPPEATPLVRVIYDPRATAAAKPWTLEYAWVNFPTSTLAEIEALMGL